MEKKRRARINNSLNELKVLILDALNKDPSRHSKLEKADILEMTVKHLQKLQRQQVAVAIVNDTSVLNKYRAGFSECATEVGRYMGNMEGFDQSIRQRILGHLNHCVNSLNQMAANAQFGSLNGNNVSNHHHHKSAFPGMMPPTNGALHVHIPMHPGANMFGNNTSFAVNSHRIPAHDINNNRTTVFNQNTTSNNILSSPNESLKQTISTPPSSASSTSSHFAFNLNLHSPKSINNLPISLTTNDIFYNSRKHCPSSLSPGSSSFVSEQMSPAASDDGCLDLAVDCSMSKTNPLLIDDNVWRPW